MTTLYIDRKGIEIRLDGEAIACYVDSEKIGTVPIEPLSRVVLRGQCRIESRVFGKLGEKGVGVIILSGRFGRPTLFLPALHNDAKIRVSQYQKSLDADFCLEFSKQLITRKILAQKETLAFLGSLYPDKENRCLEAAADLNLYIERISHQQSIDAVRGLEGIAAKAYFGIFAEILPDSLHFTGRNRRPPRDPLNVVLSLGYTLVHAESALALHRKGLDPFVGFFHQLEFGRESLACDLMEPVRPAVDRAGITLFIEGLLRPDHFKEGEGGCVMGKAGRLVFYGRFEEVMKDMRRAIEALSDEIKEAINEEGNH